MIMKQSEESSQDTASVADSLDALIKRELNYSCDEHEPWYLNQSNVVNAQDRIKLVDWCYGIVDHCQLSRATVASAMEMVDRFLSMPSNSYAVAMVSNQARKDTFEFQLLTITALYVAIKVNEEVVISSDLFADMCSQSEEEIEDMERVLLSGLSWRCRAPTAFQFGQSILSLVLPHIGISPLTMELLMDEMKYMTELAVRDYYFSTQRPSTVALAAIFCAIKEKSVKEHLGEEYRALDAFLRVTMQCFEFDCPDQISEATRRFNNSSSIQNPYSEMRSLCF